MCLNIWGQLFKAMDNTSEEESVGRVEGVEGQGRFVEGYVYKMLVSGHFVWFGDGGPKKRKKRGS